MQKDNKTAAPVLKRLRFVLALTWLGMLAETVTRAFWPLWSLVFAASASLMMGAHEAFSLELVWAAGVLCILLAIWALAYGLRHLRVPSRDEALSRLDATLPGRPIQALMDSPAIGKGDAGSEGLWRAHQSRMTERALKAAPVEPDLRMARFDPFGLRHLAVIALAVGLLFGSVSRVGTVTELAQDGGALASGPTWEGWIEPPLYTGRPSIYLNDLGAGEIEVPEGSRIILRLYGEVGALTVAETISGRIGDLPSAAEPEQTFTALRAGELRIDGEGGRIWDVKILVDAPPQVSFFGEVGPTPRGEMQMPFSGFDDYGIESGSARIALDLDAVDRRHGLAIAPEPRSMLEAELPLPISGGRTDFQETLIEDYSQHPWAHLPVSIDLGVVDAATQEGTAPPLSVPLPARRFFDPLAASVMETRRDLLWSRDNARRAAMLMRAVSHRPDESDLFSSDAIYLRFRTILRRLEADQQDGFTVAERDELATALWDLAILIEDGTLGDAEERLRRAQERLAEAIRNGASPSEIEQLMQELRDATDDYMRELAQRSPNNGDGADPQQQLSENMLEMTQDDLQAMMDRIQELMEQGRMAEAQQALEELRQMMENMQVTQGQQGEPSPGQQSMEQLSETLRNQQGLSDEAFRELQEQFNPNSNRGQSSENEGFSGGEGRGQAHDGTGGEGQGEDNAEVQGEGQAGGAGDTDAGSLADRQQALRDELNRQQGGLPGAGTPEGDATREALDRAGRAMDDAENALRNDDLPEAIDRQAEALEALREGIRSLGEALAEQQRQQPGQQGNTPNQEAEARDPLGRSQGGRGPAGTEENLLQGEDIYRQARRLLDELRRRAGETDRPEIERDYLRRLLDRF